MSNWRRNKEFNSMDLHKQKMIEQLFNSLNGKELKDALPILVNWKKQLKEKGITFSKEENDTLMDIFISELSPSQRKQFELLKPLLHNNKKP